MVPVPVVSLNVPAEVFIGDNFSFTVTFDNTDPADTGYGPFIDLIFPVNGADGAGGTNPPLDGIDFLGATYLGAPVIFDEQTFPAGPLGVAPCGATQSQLNHAYAVDNTHTPLVVCGTPGDKLVSILLPFGSFAPNQPAATVTVNASLSNLADLGTPLTIRTRGGFEYGADPLDNWCCDAVILTQPSPNSDTWNPSGSVTPILLTLEKSYNGPDGETATGPNYPRSYTVTVTVANGQTVTDLDVTDYIDNNIIVTGVTNISPAGSVTTPAAFPFGPVNPPGNEVVVNFPSVTGTASFDIEFYVPDLDANTNPVLDPGTGDDNTTENRVKAEGDWDPLDPRDPVTTETVNGTCPTCPPAVTFEDHSIAIQKGASVVAGPLRSGAVLEYTIYFQVSDYFTFNDIIITDTFSDGQRFDSTFTPTISVTDRAGTTGGSMTVIQPSTATCATAGANNVIVDESQIGNTGPNPPPDGTDGSTTVTFCVSEAMTDLGAADGILQGGRALAPDAGAATGTIVFRTVVQDIFSDTYPSGDPSVDHGDALTNDVWIDGAVLDNATLAPTGFREDDDNHQDVTITQGTLTKNIYAINQAAPTGSPPLISPGDVVTYRLQYTMPSSDFEDFVVTDYLPLPIFDATEVTTFNDVFSTGPGDAPAAGTANWGPATPSFRNRCFAVGGATCLGDVNGGAGGTVPDITSDAVSNSVEFFFGDFDDPGNNDTVVDILFSVTVTNEPFADGLFLTNQARSNEGSTNAGDQVVDEIIQVELGEPVLEIRKGVIGTDNNNSSYNPDPPAPPGFPSLGSDDTLPDSDLDDADAQDTIQFSIVLENIGSSTGGAFDVQIRDILPPGLAIPPGGINLQIQLGNGAPLASTPVGALGPEASGLFGDGFEIYDPAAPTGPVCQKYHPDDGSNLIVVTYELIIDPSVEPGDVITNAALLENYAGTDGGPNHLDDGSGGVQPRIDEADVNIVGWTVPVKTIELTSEAHTADTDVAIGEIVRYRLAVEVPEASVTDFQMVDTLSNGVNILDLNEVRLSFVADVDMTASNLTPAENTAANNDAVPPTFVLPVGNISVAGNVVTFSLGDLVNNDNDDVNDEYVVIEFNALVENVAANNLGDVKANLFEVRSDGVTETTSPPANVTVVEPVLTIAKTPDGATGDAGDTVTFTVVITHPGGANTSDAFELVWTDIVPAGMTYVGSTLTYDAGVAPDGGSLDDSDPTGTGLTATWTTLQPGQSSTLSFDVTLDYTLEPADQVFNTATVTWTSLPGTGTSPNPTNTDTPGGSGAPDGERDGSGGVNDHTASDTGDVTIVNPVPLKEIVTTSEAHTDDNPALDGSPGNERPVAVGEIVRYQLSSTIPEGTSTAFQIMDQLSAGIAPVFDDTMTIQFFSDGGIASSNAGLAPANVGPLALYDAGGTPQVLGVVTYDGGTNLLTFDLGNLQNNDSDGDAEYVVIVFNVLVLNDSVNNLGDIKANFFDVVIDGNNRGTSPPVSVVIVEPVLTIAKTPDGATGDAGDTVTFTVVITHPGGANMSDAFELVWTDIVPAGMTYVGGTLTYDAGVAPDGGSLDDSDPTSTGLTATWTTFQPGDTSTLSFDVTLDYTLEPADQVFNTATVTWTSLPGTGTSPNPTGSDTPGASGAPDGERDGSGGVNDHTASDTGDVTIVNPVPLKEIVITSEAHTDDNPALDGSPGNERPVAVGEVVRYQLSSTIPEGTSTAFQVVDQLSAGIAPVFDDTMTVQFSSDGGITSSNAGLAPANVGPLALYDAVGMPQVPGVVTYDGGTNLLTFDLGNLQNNDSDGDAEYVVIVFNVLVLNDSVNNLGDIKANTFDVVIDGTNRGTSPPISVVIVEPVLTIAKSAAPNTGDGGDTITFTVTVQHDPTSTADAFELAISDAIPAGMTWAGNVTPVVGPAPSVDTSGLPTVVFSWLSLPLATTYQFTFDATLDPTVQAGDIFTNTANLTWTSLPGTGTNPNPTGSDTPGASGAPDGERNGSGVPAENDYFDSDFDTVTVVGNYGAVKSIDSTSEAHTDDNPALDGTPGNERPLAVGEVLRYRLVSTLPEGTSANVVINDVLANGIEYMTGTARVSYLADSAMGFHADFAGIAIEANPTLVFPAGRIAWDGGTRTLSFNLDSIVNNDNDANTEVVIVEFNVLVVNTAANNLGQVWTNEYTLSEDGATVATSNSVGVVIVEPVLNITKTAAPNTGDGGDTITFTVTVQHEPTSTADAFELAISDAIPAGMTWAGNVTPVVGPVPVVDTSGLPVVVFSWPSLPLATTYQFTFDATLDPTVIAGQIITNTANLVWTSLPGTGTSPNPTGSDTPGASGAPDGERNGSSVPAENDYFTSDFDTVTVTGSYGAVKEIDTTSEAHTVTNTPEPVAVGEIVRYRLVSTVAEGTSPNVSITDVLVNGIDYLAGTARVSYLADSAMGFHADFAGIANEANPTLIFPAGRVAWDGTTLSFDLDTIVNNDNDTNDEMVIVEFNVLVVNDTVNNIGQIWGNDYNLLVDGLPVATSNSVNIVVVEPVITIAKTAIPNTGDAGDPITFQIVVTNPGGANVADAFDVRVQDIVPPDMTYVGGSLQNVAGIPATTLDQSGAPTLVATWNTLGAGQTSTISFQATLNVSLIPGDTVTNTATVTWTSLPGTGTSPNPTGSDTPGASGAPDGERDGSGVPAENDYFASDFDTVTVSEVTINKGITTTSEAHTVTAAPEPLAIGEIIRYRLTVEVPEATSPGFVITDNLPVGLQFLDDNTAMIAFVSNGAGITSSTLSGAGLNQTGNQINVDTITPVFVLPGTAISGGPFGDGTDPGFSLGDIVNDDGDGDSEFVVIEFNAVVLDNANNNSGDLKSNTFQVTINGTDRGTSPPVDAQIVEPNLAIQKDAVPTMVLLGDTVTFTITVTNSGTAAAQDVIITDNSLPAGLTWADNVTPVSGPAPAVDTSGLPTVVFSWAEVPVGATYSFTFDVTVDLSVVPGTVFTNTADLVYSSLPGTGTSPNPTGSDTLGERSYTSSDTADVTVPNVLITKTDVLLVDNDGDGIVDPGETLRYTVNITNNTGAAINNAVFTDTPDPNTALVNGFVTTTQGVITLGNGAGDPSVQINIPVFANGTSVTITFDVVIDFPLANSITEVVNQGVINGDEIIPVPSDDSDTPAPDDETITPVDGSSVIEAYKVDALVVDVNGDGVTNPGDTLEYTVTITNTGDRDADNVIFTDSIPDPNTTLVVGSVTTTQGTIVLGNGAGDTTVQVDLNVMPVPNSSATITFRVTINDPLVPPTTIQVANQGVVRGDNFPDEPTDDSDTPTDDDETVTPLIVAPLIEAYKVDTLLVDGNGNGYADPGETLEYTVTITNVGGVNATGVIFTDSIPDPNTALVVGTVTTTQGTITLGNGAGDTTVEVNVGVIPANGGTVTITFQVTISDPLNPPASIVANQGLVAGDNFTDEPTDDSDTPGDDDETLTPVGDAPAIVADKVDALLVDNDGDGEADPGDTLEYTITISNVGNADATSVTFNDTPGLNTTLVVGSVTTTQGTVVLGNTPGDTRVAVGIGRLDAGNSVTITFRVTINDPLVPSDTTMVANQGIVRGNNIEDRPTDDSDTPAPDDETETPLGDGGPSFAPDLVVTKIDSLFDDTPSGDGVPSENDVLQYLVTITNVGTASAFDMIFNDMPGPNTTLVVGSVTSTQGVIPLGNNPGDTGVRVNIGEIQPGVSVEIIFNVTINSPLVPPSTTYVANQGVIQGSNITGQPSDDSDTPLENDETITPLGDVPWIEAYKSVELTGDANGDGLVSAGDTLTYTVTLHNLGYGDALNLEFTDTPDANTTLVIGSTTVSDPAATITEDTGVTVLIPVLAPGVVVEIRFDVVVDDPLVAGVQAVANQGIVGGDNFPDEPTDNPDTPAPDDDTRIDVDNPEMPQDDGGPPPRPDVSIFDPSISKIGVLEDGGVGLVGEKLTWTFTITNVGNGVGTDVVISDTISFQLRIDGADIEIGSYSINGQTVTFFIPVLNPGQTVIAHVYTTVISSPLNIDNVATLSGFGPNGEAVNASASAHVSGIETLPSTGYEAEQDETSSTASPLVILGIVLGVLSLATMTGLVIWRRRGAQ